MGLLHSAVAQWLSTVFWFLFDWVSLISEETWLPISGHHLISMFHLPPKIPFFSLVCICVVICDSWGYEPCSKHLLDQEDVDMVNSLDKEKGITLEDFKLIKMHMANCMISFFFVFLQSLSYMHLFPLCHSTVLFSNLLLLAIAYDYYSFACWCGVRFWICSCCCHP